MAWDKKRKSDRGAGDKESLGQGGVMKLLVKEGKGKRDGGKTEPLKEHFDKGKGRGTKNEESRI